MRAVNWTAGLVLGLAVLGGLAWDRHRSRVRNYWRTLG
jgi:hypothetical protein